MEDISPDNEEKAWELVLLRKAEKMKGNDRRSWNGQMRWTEISYPSKEDSAKKVVHRLSTSSMLLSLQ
jgi:hypothetical protein